MTIPSDTRPPAVPQHVTPMIHVPDVRATVSWYQGIGFELVGANEDCGEMNWALLSYLGSRVMLNAGGATSAAARREVDLYIEVDEVQALFTRLRSQAEVVEPPHDTEYGMREFIVRDPNRFWLTFGQVIAPRT